MKLWKTFQSQKTLRVLLSAACYLCFIWFLMQCY
uniref:Uncharacterized protein n=1 Tax=Anguilla anguilla TaxID=7936 RepID=A0A0E9UFU0_ANGAN